MMFLSRIRSLYVQFAARTMTLRCAGTWTALLSLTVAVASFSPEMAFVAAVSPSSEYSKRCGNGYVRIPMELPGEMLCFPVYMVRRSGLDLFIPTIFAGLTVAGSTILLRALDLWQN